jgi:hypothetical protein
VDAEPVPMGHPFALLGDATTRSQHVLSIGSRRQLINLPCRFRSWPDMPFGWHTETVCHAISELKLMTMDFIAIKARLIRELTEVTSASH